MPFRETLRKNLAPEVFAQVMDALGDDFDFDLVPRARLNKVIKQRNTLREQLEVDTQSNFEIDDDDLGAGDAGGQGTPKPKANQGADMKALEKKHKAELSNLAIRYSALDKLRAAGAKNPELILKAGLLDVKGAKVLEDGDVAWPEGDKDPFAALAANKEYEYLFNVAEPGAKGDDAGTADEGKKSNGAPAGTGKDSGDGGKGGAEIDARLDQAMGLASGISPVE